MKINDFNPLIPVRLYLIFYEVLRKKKNILKIDFLYLILTLYIIYFGIIYYLYEERKMNEMTMK